MNSCPGNVHAVILAAGASSRMGHPKQLLAWNGRTLLEHAVLSARASCGDRVIVVLGAHSQAIRTGVNLDGVGVIVNPDWQEGMASSIRAGIRALPATADAALMLLCDQPRIGPEHLRRLLGAWQGEPNRIVASVYHGGAGVPALFPSGFFGDLLALRGDRGAKGVLMKFEASLLKISLPEAELDVDRAADLERLT